MNKGFTLIETMVALAIFVIVGGAALNLLLYAALGQRNVLSKQGLVDQSSYVVEYLSRALRQAQKDTAGTCIPIGSNYEVLGGGVGVKFLDANDDCRAIFLDGGTLKETIGAATLPLFPDEIEVLEARFSVAGETDADTLQPRVTVSLRVRDASKNELTVQTTVSQRRYDI